MSRKDIYIKIFTLRLSTVPPIYAFENYRQHYTNESTKEISLNLVQSKLVDRARILLASKTFIDWTQFKVAL